MLALNVERRMRGNALDLLLNEQQSLLAETATRLCADFGGPKRLRALGRLRRRDRRGRVA